MSTSIKPSLLVEQKRVEAILNNKRKTVYWEGKKKAHEETQKGLEHYAGKLQEQVMVPIGKRGLMKGKIVNTNQVFVSLGSGWFAKVCSAEAQRICFRRISECTEMLENLEKEKKLLEGWISFPEKQQIFATENSKEIIEFYDEKEEESWRKKHAEKVKEHRKKLASVRRELEENRGKEKSEEELWRHLELLELQEEFEDELERLSEESESDESSTLDSDDDSDEENVENDAIVARNTITNSLRTAAGLQESNNMNNSIKKGIQVKKSNICVASKVHNSKKNIRSVKKVTFENLPELPEKNQENLVEKMKTVAIGEVVEHSVVPEQESPQVNRPVSKFKSSKRANKTS